MGHRSLIEVLQNPGQNGRNAGVVEHLVKPITLPELQAAIARAANGKAQRHP